MTPDFSRPWQVDVLSFLREHLSRRDRSDIAKIASALEGHPNAKAMYSDIARFKTGAAQAKYLQGHGLSRIDAYRLAAALYVATKCPKVRQIKGRQLWQVYMRGL
jgi:hypothetical protein